MCNFVCWRAARFSLEDAFSAQKATSKRLNDAFYAMFYCQIKKLPWSDPGLVMLSVLRGERKPDHSSLKLQIATVINTFFVVRGLDDSLLNTSTAIVMRKNLKRS